MSTSQIVGLIVPLVLIDFVLVVVALLDWTKRKRYKLLPRYGWLAVIVLVNTFGPILYFVLGRAEEGADGAGGSR